MRDVPRRIGFANWRRASGKESLAEASDRREITEADARSYRPVLRLISNVSSAAVFSAMETGSPCAIPGRLCPAVVR